MSAKIVPIECLVLQCMEICHLGFTISAQIHIFIRIILKDSQLRRGFLQDIWMLNKIFVMRNMAEEG